MKTIFRQGSTQTRVEFKTEALDKFIIKITKGSKYKRGLLI